MADRPRPLAAAIALLLLAGFAAGPAAAQDRWRTQLPVDRAGSVTQGPVQVSVRVNGRSTALYQNADRQDRWYLEAQEAANYDVTVRNLTGQRVGFVIAVDGLNAINGLKSHLGADEPMYVLDPYASTTVKGWRKNLGNVSKFVFVDERDSYAARTDQANGDLGWVRVVAFNEFHPVVTRAPGWGNVTSPYRDRGSANGGAPETDRQLGQPKAAPRGGRGDEDQLVPQAQREDAPSPGTGWGDNQRDQVHEVEFRPENYAAAQVILRYEYHDALERLGILPWNDRGRDRLWEREDGQLGFAQPPRH